MPENRDEEELEQALVETENRLTAPTSRVRAVGYQHLEASPDDDESSEELLVEDVTEVDSNATRFDDLAEFVAELSYDEFLEIFPDPFLVQKSDHDLDQDSEFFTLQDGPEGSKVPVDLITATVYRLKKKEDGSFPHMITVGRGRSNDVFISNHRISKFHAYFTIRNQKIFLTDAHSTNGTFYEGKALDATVATEVSFGASISFSETINFVLLRNTKLYELLTGQGNADAG